MLGRVTHMDDFAAMRVNEFHEPPSVRMVRVMVVLGGCGASSVLLRSGGPLLQVGRLRVRSHPVGDDYPDPHSAAARERIKQEEQSRREARRQ